jgi:tRNA pseudouridine32 synthase/23S rRNA pseudouridine746 synthase
MNHAVGFSGIGYFIAGTTSSSIEITTETELLLMYTIIENNPDFVIVSKHPGVNFHKGWRATGLVMQLRADQKFREIYPVHRLDTITSGLIIFARTRKVAADLCLQFREHRIEKFYCALAGNNPQKKQGFIKGDMTRGHRNTWILSRAMTNPAITQFFSAGLGNGLRLYCIKPHTGKTHQIRVALKAIGEPVFGDPIYFKDKVEKLVVDRAYLHAYAMSFTLNGKEFRYIDPPAIGAHFTSDAFKLAFAKIADPWTMPWKKVVARTPKPTIAALPVSGESAPNPDSIGTL